MEDTERLQGIGCPRRVRAALQRPPDQYRQGRTVCSRILEDQPQQQDSGHCRPGWTGWSANRYLRDRRHPDLSRQKTGKFMPTDARKRMDVLQWLMWQKEKQDARRITQWRKQKQKMIQEKVQHVVNEECKEKDNKKGIKM
eukprot:TRINITY_DN13083_c0_g2_i1.p3 TRINITY_DN13083_c0_g2~~TRINITY_DN13083_c0_g2_i1.p3  ORF type:complete len:141 (-),score=17.29 TRINITY_DN13083_c0_g2_i1:16-438(-)